jgi:hypothetical protein
VAKDVAPVFTFLISKDYEVGHGLVDVDRPYCASRARLCPQNTAASTSVKDMR